MYTLKRTDDATHIAIVNIIESERGWGQKVDGSHVIVGTYEEIKKAAHEWIDEFNSKNTEPTVPEIYWRAQLAGIFKLER